MTAIILRSIVLCLFISSGVQAATSVPATPWAPPTRVLSQDKLVPFLQKWDRAMESNKFRDKSRVLAAVIGIVPKGMRFAGVEFLGYSNPEIIDRVVAHYLQEAAKSPVGQPITPDATGEGSGEYLMFLGNIAESTFDPRIYETVLLGRLSGDFRVLYLATVNPERTLDMLFESKPGPHGRIQSGPNTGKEGHPDYFYHSKLRAISVVDAYDILSLMIGQSPEILGTERTRVFSFVAKHAKHFAMPQKKLSKPKPAYFQWYDYRVRSRALDVIEFLGTAAQVALVEEIIHDAHEVNFEKLGRRQRSQKEYEQIREKGLRIIKQIRGKSPSER